MAGGERKGFGRVIADEARFLHSLIVRPRTTGAISPSGPALTKRMASHVDPNDDLPVIELGPGTGVVTKALIERGVDRNEISLIANETSEGYFRALEGTNDKELDAATEGAEKGAGTGALIGGGAGLLLGLGALFIPGIGAALALGPLTALITGAGIGTVTGGMIGGLSNAGVPASIVPSADIHSGQLGSQPGALLRTTAKRIAGPRSVASSLACAKEPACMPAP